MTRTDPRTGRRAPTRAQSLMWGGVIALVGVALLAGAAWIAVRTGGDFDQLVGWRRPVPAGFATGVIAVLGIAVTALGVFTAVIGSRAARRADQTDVS